VWDEYPEDGTCNIALVGESAGQVESERKRPFVGPAGGTLNMGLHEADLPRQRLYIANLVSCHPPDDDLDSYEGQEALKCCAPGFKASMANAKKRGVKVVMPLGNNAQNHGFGITTKIHKSRGSVYEKDGFLIIPTFHPSFILRGAREEEGTWIGDFKKAKEIASTGWKPPKENFDLFPSLSSLQLFAEEALKYKGPMGVDLETTSLSPATGRIVVIGLSIPKRTIVIPFLKQYGYAYWPISQLNAVNAINARLMREKECIFQFGNGVDLPFLFYNRFPVLKTPHDVCIAHHVIHPEIPHNLGYIVSVYGSTPYWKDDMLLREETILQMEDIKLRTYNARDAAVLLEVLPGLLSDLDEFHLRPIYEEISRELILPCQEMNTNGMLVDQPALKKWKHSLVAKKAYYKGEIHHLCALHEGFSLTSDEDLRLLVYGAIAPKFLRAQREMEEYMDETRKRPLRRDTARYREIGRLVSIAESTHPLYQTKGKIRTTDSGKYSVKEEVLLSRRIACNNRLLAIDGLKQKDASAERRDIEKTLKFFELLLNFNEVDKLITTYTKFPIWPDGRVHPIYSPMGTNTGRLASERPNGQNIPEEARKIFYTKGLFVGPDFSNLEVRIIAYASGDKAFIKLFKKNGNVHDQNTIDLFGIDKSSPMWDLARKAAKKYMFGGKSYLGSLYNIYTKMLIECPDLKITFAELKKLDARFDSKHPEMIAYQKRMQEIGRTERRVENGFGRVRILLGDDSDIEREAVNTPIQGTGADITNKAMIAIYKERNKLGLKARFCLQAHDQLMMECPKSELVQIKRIMRKHMEMTHHLWGRDVSFPIEMKIGTNWGDLKETK
jgi:uracil-DNA glycosylase family 4